MVNSLKIALFDAHSFDYEPFQKENEKFGYELKFFETRLTLETAYLAQGFPVICCFANDKLHAETLAALKVKGVQLIALRSAGFNHVDLVAAAEHGIRVVRVPAYSPYSVAEHATGLILALNRKIHRAYVRTRALNFSLDGFVGFDLHEKTIGVIGTGRIGTVFCDIMAGFGCRILAHDLKPNTELFSHKKLSYVALDQIYRESDILSLHVPLTPQTRYLINEKTLRQMKIGAMLINTGRGGLVNAKALIEALKSGHIGSAALDVYEEEENIFFKDLSCQILQDDILARLLTFPNVLITSHQAFLTHEALYNIARTTLENIRDFERGLELKNEVTMTLT